MSTCLSLFLSILLLLTVLILSTAAHGLKLQLVHRSSFPKFKNENFYDFLRRNEKTYMSSKTDVRLPLLDQTWAHLYFVNMSIGDPQVPGQYMAMDTGSSLVWVIGHSRYNKTLYDSSKSLSYRPVYCNNFECSLSPKFACSQMGDNLCMYNTKYADDQGSFGFVGFDKFVFQTNEHGDVTVENVLFGNNGYAGGDILGDENFYGMFGLGARDTSFWRSLDSKKFSYAIGEVRNSSIPAYLELSMGEDDDDDGTVTTPLHQYPNDMHYKVDVDHICLGQQCLNIPKVLLKSDPNDPNTGITIDTGTVVGYLADEVYDIVAGEVTNLMRIAGFGEPVKLFYQLCYNAVRPQNFSFPELDIIFYGGVHLTVYHSSLFYQRAVDRFCLSFKKGSVAGLKRMTVLGLLAQQHYMMKFNLAKQSLSIVKTVL